MLDNRGPLPPGNLKSPGREGKEKKGPLNNGFASLTQPLARPLDHSLLSSLFFSALLAGNDENSRARARRRSRRYRLVLEKRRLKKFFFSVRGAMHATFRFLGGTDTRSFSLSDCDTRVLFSPHSSPEDDRGMRDVAKKLKRRAKRLRDLCEQEADRTVDSRVAGGVLGARRRSLFFSLRPRRSPLSSSFFFFFFFLLLLPLPRPQNPSSPATSSTTTTAIIRSTPTMEASTRKTAPTGGTAPPGKSPPPGSPTR